MTSTDIAGADERLAEITKELAELQQAADVAVTSVDSWWSVSNAMTISVTVLLFGLIVMALATALMLKGHDTDSLLRMFGLILIIVSAVFLIVAGYTDKQIAPVMGLLGTIAGYLLGNRSQGNWPAKLPDYLNGNDDNRKGDT